MFRPHRVGAALILLVLVGFLTTPQANHTGEGSHQDYRYCVLGNGNNVGWSWELVGAGGQLSIDTTVAGATTTGGLVTNFVDSINAARGGANFPNAQQVASDGCGPDPSAAFSITILDSSLPFEFWVGLTGAASPSMTGCEVNGTPGGCPFNPTIVFSPTNTAGVPTIGQWGVIILVLVLLAIATAILLTRRPAQA